MNDRGSCSNPGVRSSRAVRTALWPTLQPAMCLLWSLMACALTACGDDGGAEMTVGPAAGSGAGVAAGTAGSGGAQVTSGGGAGTGSGDPCMPGRTMEGDVVLATQAEVEAFEGVREVEGDLRIQGELLTSIVSLAPLRCLQRVGGYLDVAKNDSLGDLTGLDGLTMVGGYLAVQLNGALTGVDGLGSLQAVQSLTIRNNPQLQSLSGLASISSVESQMELKNNDALSSLDGLQGVTDTAAAVEISDNEVLTSVSALAGLSQLNALYVYDNPMLSKCESEALAQALGLTCRPPPQLVNQIRCMGICECAGNLNEVECP